jgi:hypothetical protein
MTWRALSARPSNEEEADGLGATSGDKSVMQLMMEADVDRTRAMAERDGLEEAAAAMAAEGETDAGGGCLGLDDPAAAVAAREAAETAAAALADVYARLDAMVGRCKLPLSNP